MINSSIRVHTIQPSQLFHLKSTFFIHKPHSQERISRSSGPYLWSKPRTVLRATHLHATSTFLGTSTCSSTLYQGLLIHQAITIHHLCIYLQLLVSYTFKDHWNQDPSTYLFVYSSTYISHSLFLDMTSRASVCRVMCIIRSHYSFFWIYFL